MKTLGKATLLEVRSRVSDTRHAPGPHPYFPKWKQERGSGTVLAIGLILFAGALIFGVAQLGVAAAASSAAQKASDLGAIAGATETLSGGDGCAKAREYVSKNGASIRSCEVEGWMVKVEVERRTSARPGRTRLRPLRVRELMRGYSGNYCDRQCGGVGVGEGKDRGKTWNNEYP